MLTNDQVYNEINKCKYNRGAIRLNLYPNYMSEYMGYIDKDQHCADMDFVHNIYTTNNKNIATHDITNKLVIEGLNEDNPLDDVMRLLLIFVALVLIYFWIK